MNIIHISDVSFNQKDFKCLKIEEDTSKRKYLESGSVIKEYNLILRYLDYEDRLVKGTKIMCQLYMYYFSYLCSDTRDVGVLEFFAKDYHWIIEQVNCFYAEKKLMGVSQGSDLNKLLDKYRQKIRRYVLNDRFTDGDTEV